MRAFSRKTLLLAGLVTLGLVCIGAAIVMVRGLRSPSGESFSKTWYLHTGSAALPKPCFGRPRTYEAGARGNDSAPLPISRASARADLNRDGKLDLVSLSESSASVRLGLGGGGYASAAVYRTGDGPVSVAVGAVNGDEAVDLVTANAPDPPAFGDTLSVLLNKGDGTFRHRRDFVAVEYPTSVAIGDVTGDLKPDLVSVGVETADVSILTNDGHGGFSERLTYPFSERGGGFGASVSIADTNGDGEADLVVDLGPEAAVLLNVPGRCRDTGYIEQAR